MARTKSPNANRHKILLVVLCIIGLIIIIGTTVAIAQTDITFQTVRDSISQFAAHLSGSKLIVEVERTQLPADGQSQSRIWVTPINSSNPLTANVIRGGGQVELLTSEDNGIQFAYTAGPDPGEAMVMFTAGVLKEIVTITLIHSEIPPPPIITSPPDNTQISNSKPEVVGTGASNSKIIITDNGKTNTTTRTDEHGRFQTHLAEPLYNGQHTLAAITVNELGVRSPASNLITITVKTEPASIDKNNVRIIPSQATAGGSYAIFVPTSLNTDKVTLEIAGTTHKLFDFNQTSVFTAILPAPLEPGTYIGNIVVIDVSGNINRFEKAVSLTVISN